MATHPKQRSSPPNASRSIALYRIGSVRRNGSPVPLFIALCTLWILAGCARNDPPEKKLPSQPEQEITALTEADQQRLRDQRAVVEKYLDNDDARQKYKAAAGKLGTIRAILQAGIFKRDQSYELQCLGVVLGDVFVQELGMEWIIVADEDGRDPAVRMPNTTIILYPLTMISKRVERGERVDAFELYNGVVDYVEGLPRQGK